MADQLEKADSLRRQVRAAMAYPTILSLFALGVLFALVAFLIPVFEKVFKDFGGKLPAITQVSVGLSHFVVHRWYLLIIIVVSVTVTFRTWKRSEWGHPQWDAFKLKLPAKIGQVIHKIALARWSRTFRGSSMPACPSSRRSR